MPRAPSKSETLSPGQLAQRWGIGVDRVRGLVECGQLPGAFEIPSSGRYGKAVRIPLATVMEVEHSWAVVQSPQRNQRGRRQKSPPTLEHFPELSATHPEPGDGSHEDDQH